jgi:acetyltransferase
MPMRNLDAFFDPRSIGIIAESFAPGTHGRLAMQALAAAKAQVPVILIGPAPADAPFPGVASLADVEQAPDLALVTLPARDATPVLSSLGERGTRAIILTRHDNHDPELRQRLTAATRGHLRLLGPGSLGVQVARTSLNASLIQSLPRAGGLAVVTQAKETFFGAAPF